MPIADYWCQCLLVYGQYWCVCIRSIAIIIIIIGALQFMICIHLCCATNNDEEIFFSSVFLISVQLLSIIIIINVTNFLFYSGFGSNDLFGCAQINIAIDLCICPMSDDDFLMKMSATLLKLNHHRRSWREKLSI